MQAVHLLRQGGRAGIAGRHLGGHLDARLHPVHFLHIAQRLQVARIVGGIVDGDGRTQLVEVLDEHPFLVEVEDAHGAYHGVHAAFAPPVLHGTQQGVGHVHIVHKLDEAEAHLARVPLLVGAVVDDSGDAAHGFSRPVTSQEGLDVRKLQRGVLHGVERLPDVRLQIGHITGVARIQPAGQMHEFIHLVPCLYLYNRYLLHSGRQN